MADHPADVGSGEHGLAGLAAEDVLHRRGERHCVAADVALHAFRRSGRARGVQDVRGLVRLQPGAGKLCVREVLLQRLPVDVAPLRHGHRRVQAALEDQQLLRRVPGELERFVDQRLVQHRLAHAAAAVGSDHQRRLCVVDARGEAGRAKAAEHHRMARAQASAGEDREAGLRDHRQVEDYPLALLYAEGLQHRCSAIDLGEQLLVGESPAFADFGRNPHQRLLVAARRDVAVERVVAEAGFAADEPARKRWPRVIEDLAARLVPMDQLRLLSPETLAVLDRTAVEFGVARHPFPPCAPSVKPYPGFFPLNSSTIRSRRFATSPARSPRGCGSVCSSTSSARSISPGKVAGPLGLASSYPTMGSAWRLAAWSRCIAARISSSIEPTASMLSEAAPKLLVIRTGWPRQVTCAPSSCSRRRRAKASICGGPVPIETIMKVASAVRLTESSARRFAVTMFAIRASSCSAVSLPT